MTTHLGFDVLDVVEHNRLEPLDEIVRRRLTQLGGKTGLVRVHSPVKAPANSRPFHWTAFSRSEVAAMMAFLDARAGVVVPFWLPSYQSDLVLTEDAAQAETILSIRRVNYSRLMFPGSGSRRHLAFHVTGSALTFLRVVDADDPGPGNPETITVDPALPAAVVANRTTVMFLKLCRLEEPFADVSWLNTGAGIADAILRLREVPNEAPT